jgi:hypothetical protein
MQPFDKMKEADLAKAKRKLAKNEAEAYRAFVEVGHDF